MDKTSEPAQPDQESVTRLLQAWSGGDSAALQELLPLVHDTLRKIARGYLNKERAGHTLETSALVNEAFLKLID